MTVTEQIIESVRNERLTATQIIARLNANPQTVKSVLHRLVGQKRILRTKVKAKAPIGPQRVYLYGEVNVRQEKETPKEINTEA